MTQFLRALLGRFVVAVSFEPSEVVERTDSIILVAKGQTARNHHCPLWRDADFQGSGSSSGRKVFDTKEPQALAHLLQTIIQTHNPTPADYHQLLIYLFNINERMGDAFRMYTSFDPKSPEDRRIDTLQQSSVQKEQMPYFGTWRTVGRKCLKRKPRFAKKQMQYLRLTIQEGERSLEAKRKQAVCNLPEPETRRQEAHEITHVLLQDFIPRFGVPLRIRSNNRPAFVVNLAQKAAVALGYYFGNCTLLIALRVREK
ncbi:hypothetical protein AAY473_011981 [Plecturocebus cupreus]